MSKRNAILAAATRLFSRNGFQGTAMAELSSLTGAATGTIFHHFKNKEDLFLHVLKDVKESILDQFDRHQYTRREQSGIEMVADTVAFYLKLAGTMEDQFLILHRYYPYRQENAGPGCRRQLESIYTGLLDFFEAGIQRGLLDGSVKVDAPRKTAIVLFAMVDGVVRLNASRPSDIDALSDSLISACRRLLTDSP
jgi:TetR/AcrR family transcriptional regulator, fatty acid metabolism regulator protein